MELTLLSVGKTKERWLEDGCAEYITRLKPWLKVSCLWVRDDSQLIKAALQHPLLLCLDPSGKSYSSEEFATFFVKQLETGGGRLACVIGGPEGLPLALKQGNPLLSLSAMTLTHQMSRLLLLEQVYRAYQISRGTPYHK